MIDSWYFSLDWFNSLVFFPGQRFFGLILVEMY